MKIAKQYSLETNETLYRVLTDERAEELKHTFTILTPEEFIARELPHRQAFSVKRFLGYGVERA